MPPSPKSIILFQEKDTASTYGGTYRTTYAIANRTSSWGNSYKPTTYPPKNTQTATDLSLYLPPPEQKSYLDVSIITGIEKINAFESAPSTNSTQATALKASSCAIDKRS